MQAILARLKEPSTHAGIAALLQVGKTFFPTYAAFFDMATMAFGSLAVVSPEAK